MDKDSPSVMLRKLAMLRRSVRRYTREPVAPEILRGILETALLAPTSWGEKVVEFIVVEERAELRALARCKRIGAPSVAEASAAVVVLVDRGRSELWIEDGSVAAAWLLLAAEAFGVGACWNHIRGREGQRGTAEQEIRELLGIPAIWGVLCVVALGHKGERKEPRSDKDIPQGNIHWGTF